MMQLQVTKILLIAFSLALCCDVMESEDSSDDSVSDNSTVSSRSSTPDPADTPNNKSLTSTPAGYSGSPTTTTPRRTLDPPTPVHSFCDDSPDLSKKRRRRRSTPGDKLPSRSTFKRRLMQLGAEDESKNYGRPEAGSSQDSCNWTSNNQLSETLVLPCDQVLPPAASPPPSASSPPVSPCSSSGNESSDDPDTCPSETEEIPSAAEHSTSNSSCSSDSGSCAGDEVTSQRSSSDSSSECGDEDVFHDEDENVLFPGANVSLAEAVLKIMKLYVEHHWTKSCLQDTLQTFRSLLPELNDIPSSVYKLFKFVEGYSNNIPPAEKHFYCSDQDCFQPKDDPDEKCASCGCEGTSKFFYFSLADQIRFLFEERNLAALMDSYKSRRDKNPADVISDIADGEEYVKVKSQLPGPYDIVLLWNTDGVSVSGSSGMSLWPVLCEISEIAPEMRSSFLLVAGVWCDTKKPPMNMFLGPFTESLIKVKEGVNWRHQSGKNFQSVVVAPLLSADAPAKAEALRHMYFSALCGCNTCEQKRAKVKPDEAGNKQKKTRGKGKTGKGSKGDSKVMRRFVYQSKEARLRSGQSMDKQGMKAEEKGKPVKGVLGRAVVSKIPLLDRGICVTAEYMHSVLLGVVKYFLLLWLYTAGPWFVGNHTQEIDHFIKDIHVPDFVNRVPKGVKLAKKYWKASEFRSWLLYYSLPALNGILPDKYFQHWILLVQAIYILLQDQITYIELKKASLMLKTFVRDVGVLYGAKYYSYNVHQLLHLCLLVKRWGPLWATSAFSFESYNAVLGALIHGTKHKGQELVNQLKLAQGVICLENFVVMSKKRTSRTKSHNCVCRGRRVVIDLNAEQQNVLSEAGLPCLFYMRAQDGDGEKYSSVIYDKKKRRVNSYVKYVFDTENGQEVGFAQIEFFVKSSNQVHVFLRIYDVDHLRIFFHRESMVKVGHMIPYCDTSKSYIVVPMTQICSKVIKVGSYFVTRPNVVERNL